jgi:hypothetical protein
MSDTWKPIVLSAKVFGHLSQGLYRTPAGAIKELVSNAYDADATLVRVHTGFPRFETFSCQDNGTGMSRTEFERLMNRGIGSSYKRVAPDAVSATHHRPLVGRLGLGILALAQICTRFDIVAHHSESQTAFRATIQFPAYTRQEMDRLAQRARQAGEHAAVQGGQYILRDETFDRAKAGVRVFTKYLRESFRKRMRSTLTRLASRAKGDSIEPYRTFEHFVEAVYGKTAATASLNLLSDYDQLLFGIALAPPLPLMGKRNVAVHLPLIAARQERLRQFAFSVEVDNIEILNPVSLPSDRERHTAAMCDVGSATEYPFDVVDGSVTEHRTVTRRNVQVKGSDLRYHLWELEYACDDVAGSALAFSGYLFQQTGRLYPRDIQGVLIRIDDVAIGRYDNSMLTYPYAEGPRYSMVSSELRVHRGFEDALNIDRDSFNELHPHYMRVQAYVHGLLGKLVFPETWGEEKQRNKARRTKAAAIREDSFVAKYGEATGEPIKAIQRVERRSPGRPSATAHSPVVFQSGGGEIKVDRTHPLVQALFRRRKHAPLVEKILIAFERANREVGAGTRRDLFYKLLTEIFADL